MSTIEEMLVLAKQAQQQSYSPYSHFKVGACLLGADDQYYSGCNIENASYSLTLCAETSAIANMVSAGVNTIKEVVLIGHDHILCTPCGACCQRLCEFADASTPIHLCQSQGVVKTLTLAELLPHAYSPKNLETS